MIIERVPNGQIAAGILKYEDPELQKNVLDNLKIDKGAWVQSVVESISILEGNWLRMYAVIDENKIKGYMIATNCNNPPLSKYIMINYLTLFGVEDQDRVEWGLKLLGEIKQWSESLNCKQIIAICKNKLMARLYAQYGFQIMPDVLIKLEW